jgi:hypothetical protein
VIAVHEDDARRPLEPLRHGDRGLSAHLHEPVQSEAPQIGGEAVSGAILLGVDGDDAPLAAAADARGETERRTAVEGADFHHRAVPGSAQGQPMEKGPFVRVEVAVHAPEIAGHVRSRRNEQSDRRIGDLSHSTMLS